MIEMLFFLLTLVLGGSGLLTSTAEAQNRITAPEEFFGFQLGADRKMARWDRIVAYFQLLEKQGGGKLILHIQVGLHIGSLWREACLRTVGRGAGPRRS